MIRSYNKFGFGKYRGVRVDHVAEVDPHYIWYVENNMGCTFTPAVKRTAREAADRLNFSKRRSVSRGTITNGFY